MIASLPLPTNSTFQLTGRFAASDMRVNSSGAKSSNMPTHGMNSSVVPGWFRTTPQSERISSSLA